MPLHNEYFSNDEDGQNKATELVGYILPVPLVNQRRLTLAAYTHMVGSQTTFVHLD